MKRKKMEKEVVHLLEWIIEYPGVWQIVCNPDGKETSPESFKMAYDMLVKKISVLSDTGIVCNTSGRRITGDGEKFMYG